ncbi:MAG: hypothetical protein WD889_01875 [Candidatus Colwellbacteria bacterium]
MEDYLKELKERGKTSRVYREYQLVGLLVAEILNDEKHKSLYIKLAQKYGSQKMLQLAKDVADRKRIKNKGAYFMKMLEIEKVEKK